MLPLEPIKRATTPNRTRVVPVTNEDSEREAKHTMASGRLIVVANRLPVKRTGSGESGKWTATDGGLVTALRPVLRDPAHGGVWVGWPGSVSREPSQRPFTVDGIRMHPVQLSQREVDAFYHCFSNRTIWPLYHDAIRAPEFDESWWQAYVQANQRFARAAASAARPGDAVWIHDYHLQLVPRMLRQLKPDLKVGFFLHIPFPPGELFGWLPWRKPLLEGLMGSDVVGFQTESDARNFASAAQRYVGAKQVSAETIEHEGRRIQVGAFPISIDFDEFSAAADDPAIKLAAASIRRKVGDTRKILLGVDRLDYTKGIDLRLRAYERALQTKRLSVEDCVLIQVAVPSREPVPEYGKMRDDIERLIGRINGEHAVPGRVAVHYFRRSLPRKELLAYYRAADVMVVTPVRDGMNLVAKEYVATRNDGTGALVLSETAGAAEGLTDAIIVNPRDLEGASEAMVRAVRMDTLEGNARMMAMRETVRTGDVHRWAVRFLRVLAR